MSFIADMQSVLRLAIRILVILCVILIVVIYGGREAQKVIAKAAQEKRNQTEQVASENQKKDAQHKQEMERLRELSKSAIDDKQRRLDAMKSDHDIEPEPLKERFEDLSQIANSSTGYKKLVWEGLSEAMKEFSVLGQEYQKAASGVAEFTKHDLQQLGAYRKSLVRCKLMMQKINFTVTNYREFLEKNIPEKLEAIPFEGFDPKLYTATRNGFIDGGCQTITPTALAHYKSREHIWDLKIAQVDYLIEKYGAWEIGPDEAILFESSFDRDEFDRFAQRISEAEGRSIMLEQKMLNEKRERLNQ